MHILYVTTIGGTMVFFKSFIKELLDEGHTVDIATNMMRSPVPDYYREWGCRCFQISCTRSPFNKGNLDAIKELREIVTQTHYDIVHCHTPIAAACTRFACRKVRKMGTKVIYTAHGFHFFNGAPFKNWLLYYPIEKLLSIWTDYLITINREDFQLAKKKFKNTYVIYVPGVGIETSKFLNNNFNRKLIRSEMGISNEDILLLSVGELNKNKNHEVIIRALERCNNTKVHYAIAGNGQLYNKLKELSEKLNVSKNLHLLGYRNDVSSLYQAADICVFPSIREGQGLAAVEGMASGLPLLVSDNRGLRGIVVNLENAVVCKYDDVEAFSKGITLLASDKNLRKHMGMKNREISKQFDVSLINAKMKEIYNNAIE